MIIKDVGQVVWEERPARYVFVADENKRVFTQEEIHRIYTAIGLLRGKNPKGPDR